MRFVLRHKDLLNTKNKTNLTILTFDYKKQAWLSSCTRSKVLVGVMTKNVKFYELKKLSHSRTIRGGSQKKNYKSSDLCPNWVYPTYLVA